MSFVLFKGFFDQRNREIPENSFSETFNLLDSIMRNQERQRQPEQNSEVPGLNEQAIRRLMNEIFPSNPGR